MGIYIKNIKKPWRCDECMFTDSLDECIFLKTDADIDGLNIDCPIVEIADGCKTENSSEKPNNCEDCIWSVCNYNKAFEDEPQTEYPCDTCANKGDHDGECSNCVSDSETIRWKTPSHYKPKDEQQTERSE